FLTASLEPPSRKSPVNFRNSLRRLRIRLHFQKPPLPQSSEGRADERPWHPADPVPALFQKIIQFRLEKNSVLPPRSAALLLQARDKSANKRGRYKPLRAKLPD